MKLADRTVEIHSVGVQSANQFSIAQTSKMFKILSDSLYSDKVMAVVRELSTNAYDAHIAAGNKNPFKVILPTQAAPAFTVRDYGTGLSQEDMEELYTTYGASNKNTSNDFVGCLGLGSKSPFAYTKSFTTISYFNGKKLTYIAAMDEGGVPSLNMVSITDTKEPNGLEISFAVKQSDFWEFTQKSKRIYHYFKLKPIIEGGVCNTINDGSYSHHNIVIEGKGWKIGRISEDNNKYPSRHNNVDSGIVAIMGNIAYPVDSSKIVGEEKPDQPDHIQAWNRAFRKADVDNWKNLVREILNQGLYLEIQFGIGELEMDVSREGLQYTKQVIKTLRDRTQDIYLQLKQDMTDKLAGATNLIDAYQTYYNLSDLAGGWTAGASWTDKDGNAHDLTSGKDLEYKFKKSKQFYVINFRTAGYRSRRMVYLTDKIHHETLQGVPQYYWTGAKKSGKMVFFRCDIKGADTAKKIATRYCNQNDCFAYLMIDSDTPEDSSDGFDDIIKDIGGEDNVILISKYKSLLNNGPRKQSSRDPSGAVSADSIFLIHGTLSSAKTISGIMNDSHYMQEITDQEERDGVLDQDEIVYIPILRYGSIEGYPAINQVCCFIKDESCKNLVKDLFGDTKIFAIKDSYSKTLIKEGYNLISFNDFIKGKLQEVYDNKFKNVSVYNGLVEYAKQEYNKSDSSASYSYGRNAIDRQFLWHMLNIFGLDYENHVSDSKIVDLIDKCMIMEFFADTIHRFQFDINKFKAKDYFAHMTKILAKIGITGINSNEIRDANVSYNALNRWIAKLYEDDTDMKKVIKPDSSLKGKLVKIDDMRKSIKDALDNQPMLKYIVCSHEVGGNLRELTSENPLSGFRNSYYNNASSWNYKMNDTESFKKLVSKTIV